MNVLVQNSESAVLLAPPHADALAAMLADPPMAELLRGPSPPMFAACGGDPKVVWATPHALNLFGAASLRQLTLRIFASGSQGSARLAALAISLPPDSKPRLERLRFALGALTGALTCLVRRYHAPGGGALFAVAVLGVKAWQGAAGAAILIDEAAFAAAPPAETPAKKTYAAASVGLPGWAAGSARARFVWQTDARHYLTFIGPEFAALCGGRPALAAGADLEAFLAGEGVDPDGQARGALAALRTWSGVTLFCPVPDSGARMPVTLGAAPVYDKDGGFTGFRGYGILHPERLTAALPASDAAQDGTANVMPGQSAAEPDFAGTSEASADESGLADETLAITASAPDRQPFVPPLTVPHSPGIVLLRTSAPLIPAAQASPQASPKDSLNVVPIRPGPPAAAAQARPAAREDKSAEPPRVGAGAPVTLSPVERSAFREIARALGARTFDGTREKAEPGLPQNAAGDTISGEPKMPLPAKAAGIAERVTAYQNSDFAGPAARISAGGLPAADPPASNPPSDGAADSLRRNAPLLLDRLPVGIIVCRGDIPIFVNRTQLDLLGYDSADDFYLKGGISRMFRGRQPEALDPGGSGGAVPVVAADGEMLAVDARLQTISWDGLPATLISFRRAAEPEAVPRLRAAELDLRARETELRELNAILDTATDGVAVIDEAGRILSLNRSAQAVFGYDLNEVSGESFSLLFAQQSHAIVSDYFDRLRGVGPSSVLNDGREVIGRERQGGAIPLYLTLGRISQANGGKFCAVLRDLTQFRRAERELGEARKNAERASALKSDFLAKVSHEIRTPLNSILGFTEVIMDERLGPVGNDRYKDYLRDIHASGSHVLSLVNDLLDLSKIESGKTDMNFIAVDANRIISESVSLMQPQAAKVRVIMRLSLAEQLPSVVADERSLRQIALNLLSNAIKFTEPGGQIIISTAMTEAGNAVIRVKDTGIGMTEEEIGAALEPFRQIATSRKTVGTGLGLPLTKALIEANRASLSIKSRRNEGTLVEVMFPATRVLAE